MPCAMWGKNSSVGRILTYYVDHRRALLFAQWLAGLGLALFLWFVGSLRGQGSSLIPRPEAFRATEIALRAQRAAESGKSQRLVRTDYR